MDAHGETVAKEFTDLGGDASYMHLDTSQEEQWKRGFPETVSRYGRIDILVNAAGRSGRLADGTSPPLVDSLPLDNWEEVMSVNST